MLLTFIASRQCNFFYVYSNEKLPLSCIKAHFNIFFGLNFPKASSFHSLNITSFDFPDRIFASITLFSCLFSVTGMTIISEFQCGGRNEPMLCCFVRIDLGFFSLFHCVIRRPMLCHYGAQAWVEAAGERGSALFLSLSLCFSEILLRMSPSVCLSICLRLFNYIYLSVFQSSLSPSASPSHTSMQM